MPTYNSQSFVTVSVLQSNLQASDAEQAFDVSNEKLQETLNKINEVINQDNEYISDSYVDNVDEIEDSYTPLRNLRNSSNSNHNYTSLSQHYNK